MSEKLTQQQALNLAGNVRAFMRENKLNLNKLRAHGEFGWGTAYRVVKGTAHELRGPTPKKIEALLGKPIAELIAKGPADARDVVAPKARPAHRGELAQRRKRSAHAPNNGTGAFQVKGNRVIIPEGKQLTVHGPAMVQVDDADSIVIPLK